MNWLFWFDKASILFVHNYLRIFHLFRQLSLVYWDNYGTIFNVSVKYLWTLEKIYIYALMCYMSFLWWFRDIIDWQTFIDQYITMKLQQCFTCHISHDIHLAISILDKLINIEVLMLLDNETQNLFGAYIYIYI